MRTGLAEPIGLLPLPAVTHGKVRNRVIDASSKVSGVASEDAETSRANGLPRSVTSTSSPKAARCKYSDKWALSRHSAPPYPELAYRVT